MSQIEFYGSDADRIRHTYRTSLGRDASDDEVSGWLSGSYGGGGVDQWVSQIADSHEAQQRRQPQQQAPEVRQPDPNTTSGPMTPTAPQQQDDPWERARQGLANTYQQYLGRAASGDEVNNWLSGNYGYGGGLENYDKYINAIMGSHEARNYRPPAPQNNNGYQDLQYWQSQGVPAIDIFDPMTGQIKQGWQRTGRGYERVGGAGPTGTGSNQSVPPPQGGNFQSWFQSLTQGRAPSPQALRELEPILNQYGIRVGPRNARGWSDTIILPDGTVLDVIEAATENGGKAWSWFTPGHGGNNTPQMPGNQFSDPYTRLLEELMRGRISRLGEPVNDPFRQQYMDAMNRRTAALTAAEPDYQRLRGSMEGRIKDLRGPGYTGAEGEVIRTQALDPLEQDRQAARQRLTERLAARGITPDSGIFQKAMADLDSEFDGMRATTQTALTTSDLQRREGRNQRADAMEGGLYDVGQARAREQLDVFSAMDALSALMRAEEDSRGREQISLGGALADLGPQRLQLAMQAAGMGGSPTSNFSSLMQLANLNQNAALLNQRNSGQLWSGLGSMAAILANAGR